MDEHESAPESPAAEPWDLLPTEVVCRNVGCNLAYHKHLPECPVCKELAR